MHDEEGDNMVDSVSWLLDNANYPIKYNLYRLQNSSNSQTILKEMLSVPEIQYWLHQLDLRFKKKNGWWNIHGSHDYRFENIMGKLSQLGLHKGIKELDNRMRVYRENLNNQVLEERSDNLSFGILYSYYDYELLVATFLALAGYRSDSGVMHVLQKRIEKLYEFTKKKRYDIYVDGSKYPGVKKEWQTLLIDPDLYQDGNISIPTIHDYFLLSAYEFDEFNEETKKKVDTIVEWIFDEKYQSIPVQYGYFWIPGGSYSSKNVCWKLTLPSANNQMGRNRRGYQTLIQKVLLLSHFPKCYKFKWIKNAVSYLETFKTENERYLFPKELLVERKDGYWIFGAHMGMAENRRQKKWREIESTYWMERIKQNRTKWS